MRRCSLADEGPVGPLLSASDPDPVGHLISSPRLEGKELPVIDGHAIMASDAWGRKTGRCPRGR